MGSRQPVGTARPREYVLRVPELASYAHENSRAIPAVTVRSTVRTDVSIAVKVNSLAPGNSGELELGPRLRLNRSTASMT